MKGVEEGKGRPLFKMVLMQMDNTDGFPDYSLRENIPHCFNGFKKLKVRLCDIPGIEARLGSRNGSAAINLKNAIHRFGDALCVRIFGILLISCIISPHFCKKCGYATG